MMDFNNYKSLSINGISLKQLYINGVQVWEEPATYKNWVRFSTEADGVTIYNNGLGYKDGYRVRSGGAEATQAYSCCTGFIPFKQGDTLRIYPPFIGLNTSNTINFADSSFNNLGQITDIGTGYGICAGHAADFKSTASDGFSELHLITSLAVDVAYVRIVNLIFIKDHSDGGRAIIKSGSEMIVTVNEELVL